MPEQVFMPRLSDTMTEGTVSKWLKRQGDEVKKGEPIVEIETDKANIELEAYASGKLARIILQEGQSASVGEVIGEIAVAGEATSASAAPSPPAQAESPGQAVAQTDAQRPEPPRQQAQAQVAPAPGPPVEQAEPEEGQLRASPMARRLARELGVDLAQVKGSGPLGRIQKEDVEAAAKAAPAAAPVPAKPAEPGEDVEVVPLSRMQQTIARRMVEAKGPVPHFYVSMEVDMARALDNLEELNEGAAKDAQVTINDLIVRACALALRDYPDVNSSFQDGKLIRNKRINVGVAVAVQGGLIEPVIRDADSKTLKELSAESKALALKVREGKVEPH